MQPETGPMEFTMALGVAINGIIYLVLDEENITRIQQHDPFDFTAGESAQLGPIRLPPAIVIAYAKKEEYDRLLRMSAEELVKYLRRGYTETASDFERMVNLGTLPKA